MIQDNRKLTIIAKPTHSCNLRCKYCYVEETAEKGNMSEQLLSQSIERVSDFANYSHWIWHGGEPLLMGLDFFKLIEDIQNFYRKREKYFSNGIQTNGTLISDDLINFVQKTHDFHIGMSLDGPEKLNDSVRIYENGNGCFRDVYHNIRKLKNKKNVGGGVICVVSTANINYPQELYSFFKEEKINVKFNPLIKSGRAQKNIGLGITPKRYGDFLTKLWDIYNEDSLKTGQAVISIDPFIDIIGNLETGKPMGCNYSVSCRDSFISIGPQGDIYPCGRFDGIKKFWMGNVKIHKVKDAVNSEINKKLMKRGLEKISSCEKCSFSKVCNSGCMHNAYCEGDINQKDPYCLSYTTIFKKLKEVLDLEKINLV